MDDHTRHARAMGDTRSGLVLIGLTGGATLALLSAGLFLFRAQCEPFVRLIYELATSRHGIHHYYDPKSYYFWAWLAAGAATLWTGLFAAAILGKPGEDARIEKALQAKRGNSVRGAPTELRDS